MAKDQTLKIIDMQSFIGGEADNPYMGPANSCARAVGVDLRTKPGIALLEQDVEQAETAEGTVTCLAIVNDYSGNPKEYICTYKEDRGWVNGVKQEVIKSPIRAVVTNEGSWEGVKQLLNFYICTSTSGDIGTAGILRIYRQNPRITTLPIEEITYPDGANGIRFKGISETPVVAINTNSKIYIACGREIRTLDDYLVMENPLVLPIDEHIVGMTEYLGTIKIYTTIGDMDDCIDSCMYTWDGVDYLPSTRQIMKGMRLKSVINDGAYDYGLATRDAMLRLSLVSKSELYVFAGTQKQLIKTTNSMWKISGQEKIMARLLCINKGLLYISGSIPKKDNPDERVACIFTYGTITPGIEKSFITSYISEDVNEMFEFGMFGKSDNFTFATEDKIVELKYSNRILLGYIDSMYYTNDQWKDMAFEMMKLKVRTPKLEEPNKPTKYTYVNIYYRTHLEDDWTLFKTITNYDDEKISISIREFNENDPGEFVGIQFRFELSTDDDTISPEIGRCTVFLREINENK